MFLSVAVLIASSTATVVIVNLKKFVSMNMVVAKIILIAPPENVMKKKSNLANKEL
jgi:hypothetical protein